MHSAHLHVDRFVARFESFRFASLPFNASVNVSCAQLRGLADEAFFIFGLSKLYRANETLSGHRNFIELSKLFA